MPEEHAGSGPLWEYTLVVMGNPLQPGVEERANAFGRLGWELVAIDAGVWVFKRPRREKREPESLQVLMEQTVPIAEEAAPPSP